MKPHNRTSLLLALFAIGCATASATAAVTISLANDAVLDSNALLFSTSAPYGRAINGVSYQTEALMTVNGYQYATWYHRGGDEDVYLARRALPDGAWEIMDTGANMTRTTSDGHNVISMGISGDGVIHLSWDHHNHTLRYMNSVPGAATGGVWNSSIFNAERNSLNVGGSTIYDVTYPRFISDPSTGDMYMTYRTGISGNGDMNFTTYNVGSGTWDSPHQIINGTSIDVNPYLNGVDVDATGRIHITWTWRSSAGGTNYNIMYIYSDDGGDTWRNGAGQNLGVNVYPNEPGLVIDDGNSGNGLLGDVGLNSTLMNQQTQAIDADGRMHAIMWHANDTFAGTVSGFNTSVSDYFHYYRDPTTGEWARTTLPTSREVGGRADMAYAADGTLFAAFVTAGVGDSGGYYTDGDLVIVAATKAANYTDWEIVFTDTRDFSGEPRIDQARLLSDGVLSVFIQENSDAVSSLTGTPLHILDFDSETILTWVGDASGTWSNGGTLEWDTNFDGIGDSPFTTGQSVLFNDLATNFAVQFGEYVSPSSVQFENNAQAYTLTGTGISGSTSVQITGGGTVTFASGFQDYTGDTIIEAGTLALTGRTILANTPEIYVAADGVFDVTYAVRDEYLVNGGTVILDGGDVLGNLRIRSNGAISGDGVVSGNLNIEDGVLRVGDEGIDFNYSSDAIDDFQSYSLGNVRDVAGPAWTAHGNTGDADIEEDGDGNQFLSFGAGAYMGTSRDLADGERIDNGEVATFFFRFRAVTDDPDGSIGLGDQADTGGASFGDFETQIRVLDNPWASDSVVLDARDGGAFTDTLAWNLALNTWYNVWMVIDQANDTYDVYLNTGLGDATASDKLNGTALLFRNGTNGALDKFLALGGPAPVSNGVHIDDLFKLAGADLTNPLADADLDLIGEGEVFTINGDAVVGANGVLEVDMVSPAIVDRLDVGGLFTAGGTLRLALADGAPAPQVGDAYQILAAASFAGAFSSLDGPALAAGEVWDLRGLGTTGTVAVRDALELMTECVVCVTGPDGGLGGDCTACDLDSDGDVDLFDFAVLNACTLDGDAVVTNCLAEQAE